MEKGGGIPGSGTAGSRGVERDLVPRSQEQPLQTGHTEGTRVTLSGTRGAASGGDCAGRKVSTCGWVRWVNSQPLTLALCHCILILDVRPSLPNYWAQRSQERQTLFSGSTDKVFLYKGEMH